MKALSIRQPWPHHIFYDGKPVENRSWPTKYRGSVLIHAGKQFEQGGEDKPRGGIVGRVDIVDCVNEFDSDWFFGPWGFVLENPRPYPLIPCKGQLGFFTPDITDQVVEMYRDAVLSEGQASCILSMDRIELRKLADLQEVE